MFHKRLSENPITAVGRGGAKPVTREPCATRQTDVIPHPELCVVLVLN
jgi:hypothetical protein